MSELSEVKTELDGTRAQLADIKTKLVKVITDNLVMRQALADAIRRPMGVIPESCEPFCSNALLDQAEARRKTRVMERRIITEGSDVK